MSLYVSWSVSIILNSNDSPTLLNLHSYFENCYFHLDITIFSYFDLYTTFIYLGTVTTKVLAALDALDRHRFDRVDTTNSLDTLYVKVSTIKLPFYLPSINCLTVILNCFFNKLFYRFSHRTTIKKLQ